MNVTDPVGRQQGKTVAVSVTICPAKIGFALEDRVVVVGVNGAYTCKWIAAEEPTIYSEHRQTLKVVLSSKPWPALTVAGPRAGYDTLHDIRMHTYKYLPPDRVSFFADGLLRFSQPDALNDPFECIPVLSIEDARQVLEAVIEEKEATILYDILNRGLPRRSDWEAFQQWKSELQKELSSNPEKFCDLFFASSEESVGHRYSPMGAGSSARAAREPDVG